MTTHEEVFRQIVRLKRQWGYGRWTRQEAEAIAASAADVAVAIQVEYPPELTVEIPRILHRVVPEQTTVEVEERWARACDVLPHWEHVTWRDPLEPFGVLGSRWQHARHGAQLADMIRVDVLLEHGGVYIDSDVEVTRSLDPLLEHGAFAAWEDEKSVPNAVMGCSPGHPAMRALAAYMQERIPGPVWWAGPGATTAIFNGRPDVKLLGPESFYGVHYSDPDRDRKMADWEPAEHPESYGLHWYAGSWIKQKR